MPPYKPHGPNPDTFPPAPFWQIVCAGLLWVDDVGLTRKIGVAPGASERDIVSNVVALLERHRPKIITFNGRKFDLPVLRARAMRYGIPCPYLYTKAVSYRYGDDGHLDLCDALSDYGAGKSAGLDPWARLAGWPGKIGEHGDDVASMIAAGRLSDVEDYCLEDVTQTQGVALRFGLTRGTMSREEYTMSLRSLIDAVCAEPRLSRLAKAAIGECVACGERGLVGVCGSCESEVLTT